MKINKRCICAFLSVGLAVLLAANPPSVMASEETPAVGDTWVAGADSDIAGVNGNTSTSKKLNPLDTQGQFNFYYWYVIHEYGKEIDYSKMKLCVEGKPIEYYNVTQFMPEESDIKPANDPLLLYEHNAEYFTFTDWGALSGSSGFNGVYGFDPVIEFRAPVSGTYLVEIQLGGGIRLDANGDKQVDDMDRVSDGIVWKVLDTNKEVLKSREMTGDSIALFDQKLNKNPTFKKEVELAEGESIFITPDQLGSSICDDAYFSFKCTLKKIDKQTSSTEPPVTEPPATEPPATEPPATEPPATEPPATEPPATEPPATEPPATDPSATEPSATEPSATEPPATEPSTGESSTDPVPSNPATAPTVSSDDADDSTNTPWGVIIGVAVAAAAAIAVVLAGIFRKKKSD